MNWSYLQQWAMSMVFFAPALIILALALFALPLAKQPKKVLEAERNRVMQLKPSHAVPSSDDVAEESA